VSICFIALGSNLDAPSMQLQRARLAMANLPDTRLLAESAIYRTAAMTVPGSAEQPDYYNAVIKLQTALPPHDLLAALHAIEVAQGRQRIERWAARTLDLDILLYDDLQLQDARLTIPHPGMAQRHFVLYPLQDIAPDIDIPGAGRLTELIANLPLNQTASKLERTGYFNNPENNI
jgi:2-amino-4-hydroxy-6-hydroxymethyldihydropteridine diphosphokinase